MIVKNKENVQELVEELKIENTEKKKRDISVDLIRIFACLTVIATHLSLQVLNPCFNRIDWSRLLEKCFLSDGVALFFMITGFFLVNGRSYKKIWKSTIVKVLIPSLIYILVSQVFCMFILNKESIVWCLQNIFTNINVIQIFKSILTGNILAINSLCGHLWYIFSYIKIIIWIPVLWLVCTEEKTPKLARRMIIAFGILATLITDIQKFVTIPSIGMLKIFEMVDIEILYVLLGYELFLHKDKFKNNKKLCIFSIIGFIVINLIRYKLEVRYMVINSLTDIVGRMSFLEWKSSFSIISSILVFIAIYSFEIKSEKISKVILWISDKTFGIYLIHYLIIAKVDLYKFETIEKFSYELIYLFVGTIATFVASVAIVYIFKRINKLVVKIGEKNEKNVSFLKKI